MSQCVAMFFGFCLLFPRRLVKILLIVSSEAASLIKQVVRGLRETLLNHTHTRR